MSRPAAPCRVVRTSCRPLTITDTSDCGTPASDRSSVSGLMIAAPVAAQNFSDSYTFLKAMKERDGEKVSSLVSSSTLETV